MNNFLISEVFDNFKNKEYNRVVETLKPFFSSNNTDVILKTSYIYAKALYELKNYTEALNAIRIAYKENKSDYVKSLYASIIYKYINEKITSNHIYNEEFLDEFIRAITSIHKLDSNKKYIIGSLIVQLLENIKPGNNIVSKEFIFKILNNYDDSFFNHETYISTAKVKINSNLIRFYFAVVKHLYALKQFEKSIELSKKILKSPVVYFVNKIDHWFYYYIFLSYINLKDKENSYEYFKILIKTDVQWFYYKHIASLYYDNSNLFLQYMFLALDFNGLSVSKLNVIKKIADLLSALEIDDNLKIHLNDIYIYLKNNEIKNAELLYKKIKSSLKNICLGKFLQNGYIEKIKPISDYNFIGFIKSGNNSYFFRSQNVDYQNCKINDNVKFYLIDAYDKKKNRYSKEAIYIEPVNKNT